MRKGCRQNNAKLLQAAININIDINNNVYDNFNKLKVRLSYIAGKINNKSHIVNWAGLTTGEMTTLKENEYL